MEPEAYAEFICKPKEWGGMPELRILSEYYKARITVIDIGADDAIHFGPTGGQEIFLLFDGTHYNLAVQNERRVFPEG